MPKSDLDLIDRRIVAALQADGRLTNTDLAQRVGLSASPCLRRVKRLEREGYIEGYRAMLRRDQIDLGLTVFVSVKIEGHANDKALEFERVVVAFPEVVACHMVSGEADYLLEAFRGKSDAATSVSASPSRTTCSFADTGVASFPRCRGRPCRPDNRERNQGACTTRYLEAAMGLDRRSPRP